MHQYHSEVQFAGFSDSTKSGPRIRVRLPDRDHLQAFIGKEGMNMAVMLGLDDGQGKAQHLFSGIVEFVSFADGSTGGARVTFGLPDREALQVFLPLSSEVLILVVAEARECEA